MENIVEKCSVLSDHQDRVWSVAWNPTGDLLASASSDKTIRIWKRNFEQKWICTAILTDGHSRAIRCAAWSPCGNYLATASFDATICIWRKEIDKFECIASLEGHENEVKCVAWSVCGHYLASCSRDKSVWIWEVDEGEEFECLSVMNAHTQDVKKVVWHPNDKIFASASYDDTIKLYVDDGDDWTTSSVLESHKSTVWSVCFDKTGNRLASCSDDRTLKIWQKYPSGDKKNQWSCDTTLSGYHTRPIYDVQWCHLTGLIATACGDNTIRLFREIPGPGFEIVCTQKLAHTEDVNSIAWNPKVAGCLASASDDGLIKVWQFSKFHENFE